MLNVSLGNWDFFLLISFLTSHLPNPEMFVSYQGEPISLFLILYELTEYFLYVQKVFWDHLIDYFDLSSLKAWSCFFFFFGLAVEIWKKFKLWSKQPTHEVWMVSKLREKNFSSVFYFKQNSDFDFLAWHKMYTRFYFPLQPAFDSLWHEALIFFSLPILCNLVKTFQTCVNNLNDHFLLFLFSWQREILKRHRGFKSGGDFSEKFVVLLRRSRNWTK